MRKIFIIGLILVAVLATGCDKKKEKYNENSNEVTEQEMKFEPIGCYRFKDDKTGLYGYMDGKGEVIIDAKYKSATDFQYLSNEYAQVYDENETVTIIDKMGNEYLPFGEYKVISLPRYDLMFFKDDTSKYGVVNLEGERVLEAMYDKIEINNEGTIIVTSNKKYGVFDKDGNVVLDIIYDYIFQVEDSLIVTKEDKSGLVNLKGKEVIPINYEKVQIAHSIREDEREIFEVVNSEGKIGFFDSKGKQLTDFIYDKIAPGREGLIPVLKDNKWGYIDVKGETIIPLQFESASSFSDGSAQVEINNERKFINKKGEFIEEEKPSYVIDGEKYTIIKEADKYKVVSENGEVLIDNNYTGMSLYNDSIRATNEDMFLLLDLKGNILAQCKALIPIGLDLFIASDKEWEINGSLVDDKGNILSNETYVEALGYEEFKKVVVKRNDGKYAILNEKGEKLLDIEDRASKVTIFEEDLIRVEYNEEDFKWINSKGELLPKVLRYKKDN